jgi:serine/threonine protein kinase
MGMVFEAEHVRLKRRLAVKVLAQHLAKDAHALARFNREAEIISQLQHPHVVQVTDFDTTRPVSRTSSWSCWRAKAWPRVSNASAVYRSWKP